MNKTWQFSTVIIFLLAALLAGCSTASSPLLPKSAKPVATEYLIGPGDKLNIFVWRNPDLSAKVTVRPDGKISSPLIDELDVSGMKVTEVARRIEQILSVYIRDPKVSVIVSGFNGASSQQIRVIGNASEPKVIPYRDGLTLLDIMIEAQGLSEFADGDHAKLIRTVNGRQKEYTILLDSLVKGGDISKNRKVYPGDTIIIPESWF